MVSPRVGLARLVRLTSNTKIVRVTLRKREAIDRDSIASPGADYTGILSSIGALSNDLSGITTSWRAPYAGYGSLPHQP